VPLDDWKVWLRWHVLRASASLLSSRFVDADFDFYGRTLTGAPELKARWKRGVAVVESALAEAVGKLYVAEHFPPEAKAQMLDLVANLIEAYRRSITDLPWMTDETRARALAKLEQFTPKVGYPDRWRDYSALEIDRTDLVGNLRRAASFEADRDLGRIGQPVDTDEWFMSPQTVNAYYNPLMNEIVFPAAILQPPFFHPDADPAVNYGAIGAVIGHEIGHGFDDQGSRYDGDGNLNDWWTADDRDRLRGAHRRAGPPVRRLEPRQAPGQHVNGAFTLGENIGDLGGLAIAHAAYRIATDGTPNRPRSTASPGRSASSGLGPGVAVQVPRRGGGPPAGHRPALAAGVAADRAALVVVVAGRAVGVAEGRLGLLSSSSTQAASASAVTSTSSAHRPRARGR
jgi:putative endopeptidase